MPSFAITTSTADKLSSSKLKVDESTANTPLGRALTVTDNIPAGSRLLSIDLIRAISVLDNGLLNKTCSTCFSKSEDDDLLYGKKLLACNACRVLRYCSRVPLSLSQNLIVRNVRRMIGELIIGKNANIFNVNQKSLTG